MTTTVTSSMTTLPDIAELLDALAPLLAAGVDVEWELYTPLRRVIAAARHQASLETSLRIRDYLELHCRGCGVEHDPREWYMGGHWCAGCRAAGVPMSEPLWSPEDWPDEVERRAGRAQVGRAEALLAEGAWREAQVELEDLHARLYRGERQRERIAVLDMLVGWRAQHALAAGVSEILTENRDSPFLQWHTGCTFLLRHS
jgi:hypothetical protein